MMRLVRDREMAELYLALNDFARQAEDALQPTINEIRQKISRWARINQSADGEELIDSRIITECEVHGLIYMDDNATLKALSRRPEDERVRPQDCYLCEQEEEDI